MSLSSLITHRVIEMEVRICKICGMRYYSNEKVQDMCHSCLMEFEEFVAKYKKWRGCNEEMGVCIC